MTRRPLRRILLLEDDPDIQDLTGLLLAELGSFEVRGCRSAAEGLKVAPAFDPDLILLDVTMPDLGGRGAFAAFRQMPATASVPIIFMTACVRPREIMEYRQLGALGVIPKLFDADTLADTIQGMWDRYEKALLSETRRKDLAELRRAYVAELPERMCAIGAAAASLRDNGWDSRVAASLCDMAHRLAGSAATYGFPAVSEAAFRIESVKENGSGSGAPVDTAPLLNGVAALSAALQRSMAQGPPTSLPGYGTEPAGRGEAARCARLDSRPGEASFGIF